MSKIMKKILADIAKRYVPPPDTFIFGEGIDWLSPLAEVHLYVELPFWLMMPAGPVDVKWSGTAFTVNVCPSWMEVFAGHVSDSRISCMHEGPLCSDYQPPAEFAAALAKAGTSFLRRPCKTVLSLTAFAHTDAFRERTDAEPPRARAEQQAYWASLCEAHLPVINELIQRYRLVTYDYFAYEVSAWDVPVWYLKHADCGYRAVLLPYKSWDDKPTTIEDGDSDDVPPKIKPFQWTTSAELNAASSADATPGEFDLLDARSLMERGDYTGAVRRTVTAIEAVLEWALLGELQKKYPSAEAEERLQRTANNFPGRLAQWRKLAKPAISQREFDEFEKTRKIRHQIVHRGLRLTRGDCGRAQRAVDTGRWLYTKIEAKPDRAKLRNTSIVLKSMGRATMEFRFTSTVGADGITLLPLGLPLPETEPDRKATVLLNSGSAKDRSGDAEGAIADYTAALEIPGISTEMKARALFSRAIAKGKRGDAVGEIADYTAVVDMPGISAKSRARSLVNRGKKRSEINDALGAIADFSAVLELSDAPVDQKQMALCNRGSEKGKQGDIEGAIADYTTFVELPGVPARRRAQALSILSLLKGKKGDLDGVIVGFSALLDLPDLPIEGRAYVLLARAMARNQKNDAEAEIADCTTVIGMEGTAAEATADALLRRGVAVEKRGDIKGALVDYTAVAEMTGVSAEKMAGALAHRAFLREQTGDASGAIADYITLVEMPQVPATIKAWAILNRWDGIGENDEIEGVQFILLQAFSRCPRQ